MTLLPIDVTPSDRDLLIPAPGNAIEPTGCIFKTLHDREVPGRPEADPAMGISRVETAGDVTAQRSTTLDEVHGFGSPAATEPRWGFWRVATAYR
jgi:hypothetical protein